MKSSEAERRQEFQNIWKTVFIVHYNSVSILFTYFSLKFIITDNWVNNAKVTLTLLWSCSHYTFSLVLFSPLWDLSVHILLFLFHHKMQTLTFPTLSPAQIFTCFIISFSQTLSFSSHNTYMQTTSLDILKVTKWSIRIGKKYNVEAETLGIIQLIICQVIPWIISFPLIQKFTLLNQCSSSVLSWPLNFSYISDWEDEENQWWCLQLIWSMTDPKPELNTGQQGPS